MPRASSRMSCVFGTAHWFPMTFRFTAIMLAITRASEICIGIVCAGVVLALTDFGGARRRLATQLAALAAEIAGRLGGTFSSIGPGQADARPVRRGLVARVVALNPVIDEAI